MTSIASRGFSANLAMLFTQGTPFLDRFRLARKAGFDAVEISTPELFDHPPAKVASVLHQEGLQCVLFNMPAGDWVGGDRGLAALPHRQAEFDRSVGVAMEYAQLLNCPRVHCLAGVSPLATEDCYRKNLLSVLQSFGQAQIDVLIEPINTRSIPGYHLSSFSHAADTILGVSADEDVPSANGEGRTLKLLFDVFHCQILHGDLTMNLRKYADMIGHVQIAGVPDRAEPDDKQEVNFPYVFKLLREELGYTGHIGCEYNPRAGTQEGLRWLDALGKLE